MKMPPQEADAEKDYGLLREADLQRHLQKGTASEAPVEDVQQTKWTSLLYTDYQLQQALNVLKSIQLLRR